MGHGIQTKLLLAYILFCLFPVEPANTEDQWTCVTQGLQQYSSTSYLACGVALAPTEALAREAALDNGLSEFSKICNETPSCRDQERTLVPARVSCSKVENAYKCVRAVHIQILDIKRSDIRIDENELQLKISKKQNDLSRLREELQKVAELKRLDRETQEMETLRQKVESEEVTLAELESRLGHVEKYQKPRAWSVSIYFGYNDAPLEIEKSGSFGFSFGIENQFISWFSVSGSIGSFSGGDGSPSRTGTPNTTENYISDASVTETYVDMGFHIDRFRVAPLYGLQAYSSETTEINYSPLGIGTTGASTSKSGSRTFFGLGSSYRYNVFETKIQVKKYEGIDDLGFGLNLGLNF